MGGMGSGKKFYLGAKNTTENYRSIDVRHWQRNGLLAPYQTFWLRWTRDSEVVASISVNTKPGRVILTYRHRKDSEDWSNKNYTVYLDWTLCNFGGKRPWFLCPAPRCSRRVATLYVGCIFACRHCYQLAYQSQRETYDDRAARRANKIREKLDWKPGILNEIGWKPKGMHWSTFEQLTAKHNAFVDVSIKGMAEFLGGSLED